MLTHVLTPDMTSTSKSDLNLTYLEPVPVKPPVSLFISSESECSDAGEDSTGNAEKEIKRPSAKVSTPKKTQVLSYLIVISSPFVLFH